jgi:hypothetical protein
MVPGGRRKIRSHVYLPGTARTGTERREATAGVRAAQRHCLAPCGTILRHDLAISSTRCASAPGVGRSISGADRLSAPGSRWHYMTRTSSSDDTRRHRSGVEIPLRSPSHRKGHWFDFSIAHAERPGQEP